VVVGKGKRYARDVPVCSTLKFLSQNLRRLRLERELTQEQLAERAGLTYRHYQQIEGEDRPGLQVVTVERLAKALRVSVAELVGPNSRPS
jgi:transcriptional regulator with XRE-family HTH domain